MLRSGGRHRFLLAAVIALAAVAAVTLAVQSRTVHPHYSRQQVISAALKSYDTRKFPRIEAKLLYRRDVQRALPEMDSADPGQLIWVVAVSGDYGISPNFGCCSGPSDYPGHNTWGLAIIADDAPTPEPHEFETNYHGDWPPFFDSLPDLAPA